MYLTKDVKVLFSSPEFFQTSFHKTGILLKYQPYVQFAESVLVLQVFVEINFQRRVNIFIFSLTNAIFVLNIV